MTVPPPRHAPTRVLITDGDTRTALACARSLTAAGHDVWVAGARSRTLAGVSRGVHADVITESPLDRPQAFASAVARLARRRLIDVVLPVADASVEAMLAHRHLLPDDVALPLPPLETFRTGTDKVAMLARAEAAGFAVPDSFHLASAEHIDAALAAVRFPAILKPHRSVVTDTDGTRHKLDVLHVNDATECRAAIAGFPTGAFPALLQQRVRGPGEGLFALRWDGRVITSFAHRRLREKPPWGGISVLRESVAPSADLVRATAALLEDLDWQGVAMVECKRDEATGRHVFIELNGRLWGSLQLAIDAGVDFPSLLVACATGDPVNAPVRYTAGVRTRWSWGDVDHLYARLAKSPAQLRLEAPYPSRLAVLRDFVLDTFRTRPEVERLDDLTPALLECSRRLLPALPALPTAPTWPAWLPSPIRRGRRAALAPAAAAASPDGTAAARPNPAPRRTPPLARAG